MFGFSLIKSLSGFSRLPVLSWSCNFQIINNSKQDQEMNWNTIDANSSIVEGVSACSSTRSLLFVVKSNLSSSPLPQGNLQFSSRYRLKLVLITISWLPPMLKTSSSSSDNSVNGERLSQVWSEPTNVEDDRVLSCVVSRDKASTVESLVKKFLVTE